MSTLTKSTILTTILFTTLRLLFHRNIQYLIYKNIFILNIALVILGAPKTTNAVLISSAETESKTTITAQLIGGGPYIIRNSDGNLNIENGIYFPPNSSPLLNAGTASYTNAVSTYPGYSKSEINFADSGEIINSHFSSGRVFLNLDANISNNVNFNNPVTVATFQSEHRTTAESSSLKPLFSRSATISEGLVSNFLMQNAFTTNTFLPFKSFSPFLNLNWDIDRLKIKSEPTSALSYMRDTVEVVQQSGEQTKTTTIGFISFLENGKESTIYFEDPTSKIIENWFNTNIDRDDNQLILKRNPDNLSVSVPLLDDFLSPQQNLILNLKNTHIELSYEAPPRAALQVGQSIGHKIVGESEEFQMHWDKTENILYFDRLPINITKKYKKDPLNGGYIEIDPLIHFASLDGREYFSGTEIRLVDRMGNVLYRASLPTLVFEDEIFQSQGFNMFAPILNISEANLNLSSWLQDYFKEITFDSMLLPELFLGFDQTKIGSDIWNQNFNTPVSAILSFSGPEPSTVPEPTTLLLFSLGFIYLIFMEMRMLFTDTPKNIPKRLA
ncbi:hypothetical protein [Nitrosococcus wardiae]|uniref:Uncharacterized protein n=1 Tax=Nitrosococcus wardiae TaxID=1814290 RepID=A0A4P7BVC1_9GAMM|nr:hypothetical protein [Nitrosococcus wardiae]QBQ53958.1 hypothetical protein E3U44_05100 [Nitrosococcus wardiae]